MKTFWIMFPFSADGREGGMDGNRWLDGRVVAGSTAFRLSLIPLKEIQESKKKKRRICWRFFWWEEEVTTHYNFDTYIIHTIFENKKKIKYKQTSKKKKPINIPPFQTRYYSSTHTFSLKKLYTSYISSYDWQRDSPVRDAGYEPFDSILCPNRSQKSQEISIRRSSNDVRTLRDQKSHRAEFSLTRQHSL